MISVNNSISPSPTNKVESMQVWSKVLELDPKDLFHLGQLEGPHTSGEGSWSRRTALPLANGSMGSNPPPAPGELKTHHLCLYKVRLQAESQNWFKAKERSFPQDSAQTHPPDNGNARLAFYNRLAFPIRLTCYPAREATLLTLHRVSITVTFSSWWRLSCSSRRCVSASSARRSS